MLIFYPLAFENRSSLRFCCACSVIRWSKMKKRLESFFYSRKANFKNIPAMKLNFRREAKKFLVFMTLVLFFSSVRIRLHYYLFFSSSFLKKKKKSLCMYFCFVCRFTKGMQDCKPFSCVTLNVKCLEVTDAGNYSCRLLEIDGTETLPESPFALDVFGRAYKIIFFIKYERLIRVHSHFYPYVCLLFKIS